MRREAAAAEARRRERACAAEAVEVGDRARACERELRRVVPDRAQRLIAQVAADVRLALQRRAAFDAAVGFDAHHEAPRLAALPVIAIGRLDRSQQGLLGTEVTEVVARRDRDVVGTRALLERGDARHELDELVRLQQHLGAIRRAAQRRGELDLPRANAAIAELDVERFEVAMVRAVEVDVRRGLDAGGAQALERGHRIAPAATARAHLVVPRFESVDRYARVHEARAGERVCEAVGDAAPAGDHRRTDVTLAQRAHDREHAVMQVGLAADQHDLACTELRELADNAQRFLGRQLVVPRDACARAAVRTRVIAAQRQLPHDVGRERALAQHIEAAALCHDAGGSSGGAATLLPGSRQPSTPSQF